MRADGAFSLALSLTTDRGMYISATYHLLATDSIGELHRNFCGHTQEYTYALHKRRNRVLDSPNISTFKHDFPFILTVIFNTIAGQSLQSLIRRQSFCPLQEESPDFPHHPLDRTIVSVLGTKCGHEFLISFRIDATRSIPSYLMIDNNPTS